MLAVVYVWRVVEPAYFQESPAQHARVAEAPLAMLVPTFLLIGATIYFGIWTSHSAGIARQAAEMLLEVTP